MPRSTSRPRANVRIGADILASGRGTLAVALLLALVSTAGTLAVPLIVKQVIDAFAKDEPIVRPILVMAGAALAAAVTLAVSGYLLARVGEHMILRLRRRVMAHALRLPMATLRVQGVGNLVARITSDAILLRAVIDVGVVQLPLAVLTVVATLVVMAFLDWALVLISIASFAVAGLAIGFVLVRVKRNVVEQQGAMGELAQRFTTYLSALTTIKAYRFERGPPTGWARTPGSSPRPPWPGHGSSRSSLPSWGWDSRSPWCR
ncbi:ABC transporter transmembrane domain-containing protein [Streptomyces nojiriensis]